MQSSKVSSFNQVMNADKLKDICLAHNVMYANFFSSTGQDTLECKASSPCFCANDNARQFKIASEQVQFKKGAGIIGRVWETGCYEWCQNVQSYFKNLHSIYSLKNYTLFE